MKALFIVTGRGLGGDSMIALNTIKSFEKRGISCEVALDESAYGTLFEKNGYKWHKISVPHAGGSSYTKLSAFHAMLKLIPATFKANNLIKKLNADIIVGILGGGAIVSSISGKLTGKPTFCLTLTPLDTKYCPKLNQCYILPESDKFKWKTLPKNMEKTFYPLAHDINNGNSDIAISKLKEFSNFDENKKTIVFSSGSSIFKGMIDAINLVAGETDEYNLVLVGLPHHEEYGKLIDEEKIIYAGYIDWINHLFKFCDLAVLTDDGVSIAESITCGKPIVALTRVKWGRYQNMAGVFKGAIKESEVNDVCESIEEVFKNYNQFQKRALYYSKECLSAADDLTDNILKIVK